MGYRGGLDVPVINVGKMGVSKGREVEVWRTV